MTKPIKNSKLEINLESEKKSPKEGFKVTLQKPSIIKKFLDSYVVGQDYAKKAISVADGIAHPFNVSGSPKFIKT